MSTATTTPTVQTDADFSADLALVIKPRIAQRAREMLLAIVSRVDYDAVADAVWEADFSTCNDLGEAIAHEITRHLVEDLEIFDGNLPDGCEY